MALPASFAAYAFVWALFLAVPAARAVVIAQFRQSAAALRSVFWVGFVCGGALVLIDALLLLRMGAYAYARPWQFSYGAFLLNLLWVSTVASTEEMAVRGLLLTRLRQLTGSHAAVALTAAVFAVMHVGRVDLTLFAVLQYFVDGLLLGWIVLKTGHIWAATGVHLGKNLGVALAFGGSKHLIDPLLVSVPASPASGAPTDVADLAAYAVVLPLCVLFFSRRAGGVEAPQVENRGAEA